VQRTGALNQRDILLREVYHRVKNNLQLVDSLLQIQARHLTDPEAKSALISLRRRVYALGLVHHQLMDSTNLKTFDIGPFLQELSNNLVEAGAEQGVSLAVRAIPLDVGLDIAIPLGLIVTELVSNALKHAFPDGSGNILVSVESAEDGNIALIVSDDGQGQAGGQTPSDQPKSGTGTRIIATLVNQLNGTITVRRDHGTRTEIRVAPPAPS
jgi:two-component sensor histidine kinase